MSRPGRPDPGPGLLLVDDRADNLLALEAVLEPLGRRMIRAQSGEAALRHLLTDEVAVIVLDVQMPGLDGFETAQHIKERERTRDIPIIFLTAISQELGHRLRGYATGAVDYIFKPVDAEILRAKVAVFLDLHLKNLMLKDQSEQLARKADELARSNSDLEQFAYIAAHDLQDPLRVIAGFVELLRDRLGDRVDDVSRQWMDRITGTAERMSRLLTDLLAYARAGTGAAQPVPVDLDDAFTAALDNLGPAVGEARAEVSRGSLGQAMGVPGDMVQVFQNLVGNAIKFQRQGVSAVVDVSAVNTDGLVTVTIRDNGRGLTVDQIERAFQVFERLDGEPYPGTGLGLAVCRKVVERAGGRIWMERHDGPGVTVRFALPAAPS